MPGRTGWLAANKKVAAEVAIFSTALIGLERVYPTWRSIQMGVIRGLSRAVGGLVLGIGGLVRGVLGGIGSLFRRLV